MKVIKLERTGNFEHTKRYDEEIMELSEIHLKGSGCRYSLHSAINREFDGLSYPDDDAYEMEKKMHEAVTSRDLSVNLYYDFGDYTLSLYSKEETIC